MDVDVLIPIDNLGSVKSRDGQFEAICWTHRGGGWDVHSTRDSFQGTCVRTKREAYALVRKMYRDYNAAESLRVANDPTQW